MFKLHRAYVRVSREPEAPGEKRILVGEIVDLLIERLPHAVAGVALDPEEDDGFRVIRRDVLHERAHLARVHWIDTAIPLRGREEQGGRPDVRASVVRGRFLPHPRVLRGILRRAVFRDPETRDEEVL